MSVAGVPLFPPWVSVHVVTIRFPETWLVVVEQLKATHPFGALPEVQVRDEQSCRAAVLRLERTALVAVGQPGLAAGNIRHRQVCRVSAVAESKHERGVGSGLLEQRIERDSLPVRIELGPPGHAV